MWGRRINNFFGIRLPPTCSGHTLSYFVRSTEYFVRSRTNPSPRGTLYSVTDYGSVILVPHPSPLDHTRCASLSVSSRIEPGLINISLERSILWLLGFLASWRSVSRPSPPPIISSLRFGSTLSPKCPLSFVDFSTCINQAESWSPNAPRFISYDVELGKYRTTSSPSWPAALLALFFLLHPRIPPPPSSPLSFIVHSRSLLQLQLRSLPG